MAELTPAQRQALDAMIAGSHFQVDPNFTPSNVGPEVVFPSGSGGVSRVTDNGLNVYSRPTVAINPLTGSPVVVAADGSRTSPIAVGGGGRGDSAIMRAASGSAQFRPRAIDVATQPNGSIVMGKDQSRLNSPEYAFAYGEKEPQSPAVAAIDDAVVMVPMPRRRPNVKPTVYDAGGDGGLYGAKMSPGMASILNADPRYQAQRTGRLTGPVMVAAPAPQAAPVMVAAPRQAAVNAQTAPYGPGTTFEQRAAAAARRESLMNPPTETNWAAIEASARNGGSSSSRWW